LPDSVDMSAHFPRTKGPDYRRADRLRGLAIVALAFVSCLLISVWARRRATPEPVVPPAPPTTVGITGWPSAVDVVKTLPRARELTHRNLLRSITVDGVKSDGTIDAAGPGRARFQFQSAAGQGPQPAREPGTLARRPYCGRQAVLVRKDGIVAEADDAEASCAPQATDPLPEPHCTLAEIWAHALERGVPKERVARIEYFRASAGPAWRFDAAGSRAHFTLYGDCKRELDGRDAANVSP